MRRSLLPVIALGSFLAASIASGQAITVLHDFSGPDGQLPREGLVEGADGDFYGITDSGGAHGFGVFYKVTAAGDFTDLFDFDQTALGYTPVALVRGCDDNFYGLAAAAFEPPGTFFAGTFFRMTPAGTPTGLHTFPNDGLEGRPGNTSSLVVAADCDIYGTTTGGGTTSNGKIFRLTTAGGYTPLYDFPDLTGPNGSAPQGLIQGSDGDFYGATGFGGDATDLRGTLFRVTSGGTLTTLHAFLLEDGGATPTWLMEASDGRFYGTSLSGGSTTGGTLFRFPPGGGFELLHTFNGPDGTAPSGPMIEASDGSLYGTAQTTAGFCCGTIIQRTPFGNIARVFAFPGGGADGSNPMGGLIQGADGRLYGTTFGGGTAGPNGGIAFAHVLPPSIQSLLPSSGPAAGGAVKILQGTTFVDGATVEVGGVAATDVTYMGPTQLMATTPARPPGTLNGVKVTNPDTSYTTLKKGWFADFLDVPGVDIFHIYVENVFRLGITAGCGGGNYCRNENVKRKQMAVFLLKAKLDATHIPPACTGTVFTDVPCTGGLFDPWIEELAALQITGGCGGGAFCPENPVRRDQMAVFLLKAEEGSGYTPPDCASLFGDVVCPGLFTNWIEELYNRGVTGGCSASPLLYCPLSSVLRGQMAVFMINTFFPV